MAYFVETEQAILDNIWYHFGDQEKVKQAIVTKNLSSPSMVIQVEFISEDMMADFLAEYDTVVAALCIWEKNRDWEEVTYSVECFPKYVDAIFKFISTFEES